MTWTSDTRDINFILNRVNDTLDRVWADCQIIRELAIGDGEVAICDIETSIEEYRQYTKSYLEAIDKTKTENEELKTENKILKAQLEDINTQIKDKFKTLDKTIKLIEENSKAIEVSKKIKREAKVSKHGAEHPRFEKGVDNEKLIKDYNKHLEHNKKCEENGNTDDKIAILKKLADDHGLSMAGIRNRLIYLGVYEQVYNKEQ